MIDDAPPSPSLGIVNDDLTITFKRDLSHCWHGTIIVDAAKREVYCGKCKKLVDPFEALGNLARDSQALVDERAHLRQNIERWRKEADDAKRQRANAIAARKRVESPEAKLLREMVEAHQYAYCVQLGAKGMCGECWICRMRAVVNRNA